MALECAYRGLSPIGHIAAPCGPLPLSPVHVGWGPMEAAGVERPGYVHASRLAQGELVGMAAAGVLALSPFLPWFSTSSANPNSTIASAGIGPGDSATAFATFPLLRWVLIAACVAPFVLAWIVVRGHKLTWRPGEVTMIVGITAFVLVLCNGIILGKPDPGIEISFAYGYLVALAGSLGIAIGGYLRHTVGERGRKPPGTL